MRNKNNYTLIALILGCSFAFAQVGINTTNPQGTFHVDGAKDNAATGAPTTGQQANDVIVTPAGRVGIGTTSPAEMLDVTGKTKTTTLQMTNGATDGYVLISDNSGNATWKNLQDVSVKKTLVTPPAGTAANYTIPCAAGFDIIQLTNSNANFATTITLPTPSCSTTGQKVRVTSTASTIATISKTYTNAYGTTQLSSGDVYEYTFTNGRWELTSFPTKNWDFCQVPNSGSTTLINPRTPKTIFYFYDGCYNNPVTLPSGGTVGDILIIDDSASLNLTIKQANTTMASDYVLVTGSYVQFLKTNLGWVPDPPQPSTNIYNANGTLTANRTVTQNANTLAFNGTAANAFSVNSATKTLFSANAASNSTGIGTVNPQGFFHVDAAGDNAAIGAPTTGQQANDVVVTSTGSVGVGTTTPQKPLHINGAVQITNELNVGGNATTAGSAGTAGQVLTSNGAGAAPAWQSINTVSGTVAGVHYAQGTSALTVAQGQTQDVPGVTVTITVPAGRTQTLLFTILGYSTIFNSNTTQGVFQLMQDGVKISSAYASKAGQFPVGTVANAGNSLLNDMPVPVTFLKSVTLSAGTYTFKVQYAAWKGASTVNFVPSTYSGYNGDTESMLTKMQVLVYNN